MALGAPSSLSLDLNIVGHEIAKSVGDLTKLNSELSKAEASEKLWRQNLAETRKAVSSLNFELKQLALIRQQSLNAAKQSDSRAEINLLNREAQETQNLMISKKKLLASYQSVNNINKETLASRQQDVKQLNTQIGTTEKHVSSLIKQQAALLKSKESQNILTMSMDKFNSVFSRVIDYMVIYGGMMVAGKVIGLFTTHMITVNEQFEKLQVRLYTLNPNLQQTARIWEEIKAVTVTSPFRITEIGQAAVMLRTFGISAVENLRVVADWASAVEKDLTDVSIAFGKIVNRSPRTALMLSTRGLSEGGYEKYIDQYRDRATALQKYLDDTFGGTAARISETFFGLKTNISDLFDIMLQKGGRPIFEKLKGDLNYIQAILKDINKGSGGETAGFFAKLIPDSILRLLAANNLYGEQQNLTLRLTNPNTSAKERLAITERLISLNELLNKDQSLLVRLWDGLYQTAHGHFFDMKDLNDVYEEQRKSLTASLSPRREAVRLANEELLTRNSSFGITSAYELQKSMEKAPELMAFLKSIAVTGGDSISLSAATMMSTLTGTITKKQVLAKIEADITSTVNRRPKADEDIVRFGLEREADLKELISEWLKLNVEKKTKELKDLLSVVKDLASVLAGQKAQLGELLGGDSNIDARIAKNIAYLTVEKVNLQQRMAYIDASIIAQDKLSKMTNEQLNSKSNQNEVKTLQHRVEVGNKIIQLTQDENTQEDKLIATQQKLAQLQERNYLHKQDMDREYVKKLYAKGITSTSDYRSYLNNNMSDLQSDYDALGMKQAVSQAALLTMGRDTVEQQTEYAEQQYKIATTDAERLKIHKQILEIQEEYLNLPSQSFGEALNKQLLLANKQLDSLHDNLMSIFLDAGREFSKGLLTEVLFGTRKEDLTSQIDDLRFQLIQMDIDKQNTLNTAQKVKLVEDQEISLLARINDLERQRSQIILTLLSDISKKMMDKLADQAINALFSLAGGLFNSSGDSSSTYNSQFGGSFTGGNSGGYQFGGNQAPVLPSVPSSNKTIVVQFNGNLYGGREFNEQIQTAITEIRRNVK